MAATFRVMSVLLLCFIFLLSIACKATALECYSGKLERGRLEVLLLVESSFERDLVLLRIEP